MLEGFDVSHHQDPKLFDWESEAMKAFSFVYVRASYGDRADERCAEHCERARAAGLKVGLYHFFRFGQPREEQWNTFARVAQASRYGREGFDLVPMIDLEFNRWDPPVDTQAYNDDSADLFTDFQSHYGQAGVYSSQLWASQLRNPDWWKEAHRWVAHWNVRKPALPEQWNDWDVWQYAVSPSSIYPHPIDRNRARTLPTLGADPDAYGDEAAELAADRILMQIRPLLVEELRRR